MVKTINGQYHMQVKDLIEELKDYPQDSIVFGIYHDKKKAFRERNIYKTAETAEPKEVYLYLGNDRKQ